jgi:hypothetical protein
MKDRKKYKVIAKVGNDHFIKQNVNNLLLFTKYLDRKFPRWRWFNVYRYTKEGNGEQLANFTTNKRPNKAYLAI